jgi:tRNA pseudouridine32 synthase/23S rRNA pseudouridine746 synthase
MGETKPFIYKPDDFIAPPCYLDIQILYQDTDILVINKPSGLLSLSGKNPLNKDSVHYRLMQDFPDALLVHRLDLGTSGVMVIALSKDMVRNLNRQFSNRDVKKTYEAVLDGVLEVDEGKINQPIARGEFPLQKICHEQGKSALTEYRIKRRYQDRTHVIFHPHTGRTHQLRVHAAAIGHAILGCDLYGTSLTQSKAPRLLLHASELSFTQPTTGKAMDIVCPCPF